MWFFIPEIAEKSARIMAGFDPFVVDQASDMRTGPMVFGFRISDFD
jgi:hypothetical protein